MDILPGIIDMTKNEILDKYTETLVAFNKAKSSLQGYIFDKIDSGENPTTGEHGRYTNGSIFIEIGSWGCEKSPINTCCYNNYTDRAFDHCIFCGHPDERK